MLGKVLGRCQLARLAAVRRWASTLSPTLQPPNGAALSNSKRSAVAILDSKLESLTEQLEKADAYMGPLTERQQTSDVQFADDSHIRPDLERLRVVPEMMSFYMANPALEEALRTLRSLVDKFTDLPLVPLSEYERPTWIDPSTLYGETKGGLSSEEKDKFYSLLDRLNRIEPKLQPSHLQGLMYEMKDKNSLGSAVVTGTANQPSRITSLLRKQLDSLGRSITVGRRKSASARVIIARARENQPGQLVVNGRSIEQYFPSIIQRQEVLYPLRVVDAFAKFNIFATVQGGGQTSQASAVGLGIAKGISVQNPLLVNRLFEAGCLTTDAREKERKKPGKAKARKSYGWVKR